MFDKYVINDHSKIKHPNDASKNQYVECTSVFFMTDPSYS